MYKYLSRTPGDMAAGQEHRCDEGSADRIGTVQSLSDHGYMYYRYTVYCNRIEGICICMSTCMTI